MRRLSLALRSTLGAFLRAVDVEGALLLSGIGLLAFLGWTFDWRLGIGVVAVSLLIAGIALARPPRSP